jgi:Cd2+/Zn2+-exporting ATPase
MSANERNLSIGERPAALKAATAAAPNAHSAEEDEIAQLPWMIRLTVMCLVATALGWLLSSAGLAAPAWVPWLLYVIAYASGGFYSIQEAWDTLKQRQFDVNFLMIIAAVGAALIGEPREGAILMFLFSLSNTLETYAMGRTHASVRALLDMAPKEADLYRDGQILRVPVEQLQVGDLVLVRPGAQIPADGLVVKGESAVDEASITGESMPVEKHPGARAFAGTLNGQGALDVRVTTPVGDSTLARIVAVVREAREQKAQSQDFTDRVIGQYYAYAVVGIALLAVMIPLVFLGWDLPTTLYRAMTLMVVASPCALVISIPAALLSALASAARGGVLFKGGKYLEAAARVKVVAFDKTGTLTEGRPQLVALHAVDGDARALLALAAALQADSSHPLAHAVRDAAMRDGVAAAPAQGLQALAGRGVAARVGERELRLGNERLMRELAIDLAPLRARADALQAEGRTVSWLAYAGATPPRLLGLLAFGDALKPQSAAAVARLQRQGVETVLLTGDNRGSAQAVARALGHA